MDLDSFLVSLYVLVDDWWKLHHASQPPKTGRPALLTESEVHPGHPRPVASLPKREGLLALRLGASALLLPEALLAESVQPAGTGPGAEMRALQLAFARELAEPSAVYRVVDTTLVPAIVRVRASRKGLFCGQATFGRSASKTEWVYGFKAALVVDPDGVITAFGLAPPRLQTRGP